MLIGLSRGVVITNEVLETFLIFWKVQEYKCFSTFRFIFVREDVEIVVVCMLEEKIFC
jgi:hypothetical protein